MQRLAKTDIKFLHGVGPKRAEMLAKQLDIHSYYDLLYYFPYRYVDKSKIHHIRDIEGDMLKETFDAFHGVLLCEGF